MLVDRLDGLVVDLLLGFCSTESKNTLDIFNLFDQVVNRGYQSGITPNGGDTTTPLPAQTLTKASA